MTMNYYVSKPLKQKLKHHCLVGYDPSSDQAVYSVKIPKSKTGLLRRFVRFESDDPEGYDCYKVEYSNVVKLLDLLGRDSNPPRKLSPNRVGWDDPSRGTRWSSERRTATKTVAPLPASPTSHRVSPRA